MHGADDVPGRPRPHSTLVRVLAEISTTEDAARGLLSVIGDAFGWPLGGLWKVDEGAGVLRWAGEWVASGDAELGAFERLSRDFTFERGVGLPGRVWATGEPAWITDLERDPNFPRAQLAAGLGLHAGVALPVYGGHGVLAVMEFFAPEVRPPDGEQLDVLYTVGRQVGQFLERRRAQQLLAASEELKSGIIDAALDCIVTMDHAGRVYDFNPAAERVFGYRREDAIGAELAQLIVPPDLRAAHRAALQRCVETGRGEILGRRLELTGMRADGSLFPVELTVTRIGSGSRPMFAGFIRDITDRRRAAQEVDRLLELEHRARLAAEAAERRASTIAATLQQSLLPRALPAVPGWEIAAAYHSGSEGTDVGGDFYDVFEAGDGRWACAMGDVTGKGVEAAAVTALARYTIRTAALTERRPSGVLGVLNTALIRDSPLGRFCTAAYASLRPRDPHVSLALAGHPQPIVLRRGGGTEPAGRAGTLLGAVDIPMIEDVEVSLAPGDVLVLYTDGLVEARTAQGRLGDDGLARLLEGARGLSCAELADRLEAAAGAGETRDDVAVLVLRPH